MTTRRFEVNLTDYHGDDDWHEVKPRWDWQRPPRDHEAAACAWCETHFADLDYPSEIEGLRVREVTGLGPAVVKRYTVTVESVPQFTARRDS